MRPMSTTEPDPAAIATAREVLAGADYSAAGIAGLGIDLGMGVRARDVPMLRRSLGDDEPLASLVRLFVLGDPVDRTALAGSLGRAGVAALERAGLTRASGAAVEPLVRLTPWRGRLIAHDPDPEGDLWPDHVSGPTPAADTLIRMVAPNGGRALDVGTGSGLLAVTLAAGQSEIVATDVNPAALRLARLTCALNGATNVELRSGSLFEPVGDAAFDLIVSNPPFVISPESDLVFRHSPFGRDEISRVVAREAVRHLADGGFATVLVNWVQPPGVGWPDTVRDWLDGSGCDVLLLLHGVEDPLAYAIRWTGREQQVRPDRHGATLDRWLAHFRDEGIEAVGTGIVVLRRRAGPAWFDAIQLTGDAVGDAGDHVRALFHGRDVLGGAAERSTTTDAELLTRAFRMREPHRLTQTLVASGGEYAAEPASLTLEAGLGLTVTVPNELVPVVLRLDGSQTGAQIAADVAPDADVGAAAMAGQVAGLLRVLLQQGMLEWA